MPPYHIPVLLEACITGLNIKPNGVYVDATFGGGGHSAAILKQLDKTGKLVVFDHDLTAAQNLANDTRVTFVNHNFKYMPQFLAYLDIEGVDGILADLGVSSHEIDEPTRGFSYRFKESSLDMRMNANAAIPTAQEILNTYAPQALTTLFKTYGEIDNAYKLSLAITEFRKHTPIKTVSNLCLAIKHLIPKATEQRYLSQLFQALRIAVNNELTALQIMLNATATICNKNARIVVLTYHSLEDRIVKQHFKSYSTSSNNIELFKLITGKPITPSETELQSNPRSRSAKLRIAERL